ncbi:hypothetical protein K2173_004946 [Erythroxylum novogranatense]|uniref:Nrap protein domain-containing protein n=1 Tax=Erythroxylum novogranatense TaxID=1862640 RepID=A0AAV8U8G5_9ROSI|nr:hypothetical protein K2173_004946 [Erythroxylum novogranatense]
MAKVDFPAKYDYYLRLNFKGNSQGFSRLDKELMLVGISVSSLDKAFRVVDIGPDVENKGEVELRRFKDGKIAESTVWESEQWTKHLIMKSIIEYVLSRHLSLSNPNAVEIAHQLDFFILHGTKDPLTISTSLLGAFEVLSKRLREDILLKVYSVQPLDPVCSCKPPEVYKGKGIMYVDEVIKKKQGKKSK